MSLRKKFRDWCPQPPNRLPTKLKRHAMPIAAVLTVTLILSVSFLAYSTSVISHPAVPVLPLVTEQSTWSRQTVSTDDSFSDICMVVDSNNNPHVVYQGANGVMYYASWDGSNWKIQNVIMGGAPNELVLDSQNNPLILYKGSNGVTYIASWEGSNWNFLALPTGNGYSLAIDSENNPSIAYDTDLALNYATGDTSQLNYASWNGSGWSIQTVDPQISGSANVYLVLKANNNPVIMYAYDLNGSSLANIKLAQWTGSNWNIQTIFSNVDWMGNIILDANGNPHLLFAVPQSSVVSSTLRYASWNGSAWSTEPVVSSLGFNSFTDGNPVFALGPNDYPSIEFFNGSLMYTSWTGASWNIQTVAPDNFAYGAGPLALDSNGNPSICYWVDDIQNKTAFVSSLIYTSPIPLQPQTTAPSPTLNNAFLIAALVTVAVVVAIISLVVLTRLKSRSTNFRRRGET